jgi:hypothetical protein
VADDDDALELARRAVVAAGVAVASDGERVRRPAGAP